MHKLSAWYEELSRAKPLFLVIMLQTTQLMLQTTQLSCIIFLTGFIGSIRLEEVIIFGTCKCGWGNGLWRVRKRDYAYVTGIRVGGNIHLDLPSTHPPHSAHMPLIDHGVKWSWCQMIMALSIWWYNYGISLQQIFATIWPTCQQVYITPTVSPVEW